MSENHTEIQKQIVKVAKAWVNEIASESTTTEEAYIAGYKQALQTVYNVILKAVSAFTEDEELN